MEGGGGVAQGRKVGEKENGDRTLDEWDFASKLG